MLVKPNRQQPLQPVEILEPRGADPALTDVHPESPDARPDHRDVLLVLVHDRGLVHVGAAAAWRRLIEAS
jgi:hypothetical protein